MSCSCLWRPCYRRVGKNEIEKDPDRRVRAAIELVFRKFDKLQSVRQVHLWFRDESLELPSQPTGEDQVRWQLPNYARVHAILTNPVYAGVYAYGRTATHVEIRDGKKKIVRRVVSDRDAWQVFIRDNHEGYISLEAYERNQRVIADNSTKLTPIGRRGAVRSGAALLAGLLRCGHCGRKLTVTYSGCRQRAALHMQFRGDQSQRKEVHLVQRHSSGRSGWWRDRAHSRTDRHGCGASRHRSGCAELETIRQHEIALERAQYEARRAGRQYDAVDPENRQVAGELERRWNERLIAVQTITDALERAREASADIRLSEEDQNACLELGANIEQAWTHEGVTPEIRKRILRAALEEIMVRVEKDRVQLLLHWRGGDHRGVCRQESHGAASLYNRRRDRDPHHGAGTADAGHGDCGTAEPTGTAHRQGQQLERVECPQFPQQTRHPGLQGKRCAPRRGGRATK